MAQYRSGSVNLVEGSSRIVGQNTLWLTYCSVGDLFKRKGQNAIYQVGAISGELEIGLTSNYVGSGEDGAEYIISRDFTPNFELPEVNVGDIDWPVFMTRALRSIDTDLQTVSGEAHHNSYADATLSGTQKVFELKDTSGTSYYFKCYPVKT